MLLTVAEAAQLLGQSPRTVRARLARGELHGRKKGGHWVVPRDVLPLPEAEHRRLQARADEIRQTVDAALPSRLSGQRRRRSVVDEVAFRAAHALRTQLQSSGVPEATEAAGAVQDALYALAHGLHEWSPDRKHAAFGQARAAVTRAIARLLLDAPIPPPEPVRTWVEVLEQELLPPIAGLCRQAEQRDRRR
jgi:excisionase family DNA binding protein